MGQNLAASVSEVEVHALAREVYLFALIYPGACL